MFTINNIDQNLTTTPELNLDPKYVRYAVYQLERGADTGHLHIQGYGELVGQATRQKKAASFFALGCHVERAVTDRDTCVAYCTKPATRVADHRVFGEPVNQGHRSDICDVIQAIKRPHQLRELVLDDAFATTFLKYHKGIERLRSLYQCSTDRPDMRVYVLFGPTGTGKTRFAMDDGNGGKHPSVYKKPIGTKWFDGYDGQKRLVLDEFSGWVPWSYLLQICDIYPLDIEAKCTTIPGQWDEVIITCNKWPEWWYTNKYQDWSAFVRRVRAWCFCGTQSEWVWYDSYTEFAYSHRPEINPDISNNNNAMGSPRRMD